eukprot:1441819-Rhodomonas_salina.1
MSVLFRCTRIPNVSTLVSYQRSTLLLHHYTVLACRPSIPRTEDWHAIAAYRERSTGICHSSIRPTQYWAGVGG